MNWVLALGLFFLLVLSLAILHMAYMVMPEKHGVREPAKPAGPVSPVYGYLSPMSI